MAESQPVGARLRAIREDRGLSLSDLSRETRIGAHFLRAIEERDYSPFRSPFFAVGFARNYARALGEPAEPIAAEARAHCGQRAA